MDILRNKQFIWYNIPNSLFQFLCLPFCNHRLFHFGHCLPDVSLMAVFCCFFMPRVFGFDQLLCPAVSISVFGICRQLLSKAWVSSSGGALSWEVKGRVLTGNLGDATLQFTSATQILFHASYCLSSLSFCHLWGYKCSSRSACDQAWWFLYS